MLSVLMITASCGLAAAAAPAVIESVHPLESDGSGPRIGFTALYRWQVDGRVTHWGHLHERTNEYLARFAVVGSATGWRIGSLELLEQERELAALEDLDGVLEVARVELARLEPVDAAERAAAGEVEQIGVLEERAGDLLERQAHLGLAAGRGRRLCRVGGAGRLSLEDPARIKQPRVVFRRAESATAAAKSEATTREPRAVGYVPCF